MSRARIYLIGLLTISAAGLLLTLRLSGASKEAALIALLAGVLLQGPLGWWLVNAVGTSRFLVVWVTGMLARFGILAIMAFVILPLLHRPKSPGLLMLGGVLVALLFLEGLVVWLQQSRVEAR